MHAAGSPAFVCAHARDTEVAPLLAEMRALAGKPHFDLVQTLRLLQDWTDADKKAAPLKAVQLLAWADGFARGELAGELYPDVAAALRFWHAAGIRLYVYSSGSIEVQRLMLAHTGHGDLTPLFSGFLDSHVGGKLDHGSYHVIAAAIDAAPPNILLVSDRSAELDAARLAGWRTTIVDRGEVRCRRAPPIRSCVASTRWSAGGWRRRKS